MKGHSGLDYRASLGTPVYATMDGVIQNKRNNETAVQNARTKYKGRHQSLQEYSPFTNALLNQFWWDIVGQRTTSMGKNNWVDLMHTIVPVAYAEFVFIDKRWENFIKKSKLEYPKIAKVYKRTSVKNFFPAFENYNSKDRKDWVSECRKSQ